MFLQKTITATLLLAILPALRAQGNDPSADPELRKTRTLINSWTDDDSSYSSYGYGELVPQNITFEDGQTVTVYEWSKGTGLEVQTYTTDEEPTDPASNTTIAGVTRTLRRDEVANHKRACKRSCRRNINYWSENVVGPYAISDDKKGYWVRTNATCYNGGTFSYCNNYVTVGSSVSGSVGLNIGIISAALNFDGGDKSSKGICFGCTAPTQGCSRLWYRPKYLWKEGDVWRRDEQHDEGNQCSPCTKEWDNTEKLGRPYVEYPYVDGNGLPIIVPGCSPCDQ